MCNGRITDISNQTCSESIYTRELVTKAIMLITIFVLSVMMPALSYANYTDNSDGTITDQSSKLVWQRCSAPSTETDCATSSPVQYNWDDALAYCNALSLGGYTDWRVPNVKELHSLIVFSKSTVPAINTSYFIDTQADYYWTSTTFNDTPGYAWYVNFNIGLSGFVMTSPLDKNEINYVRCVRGQ